MPNIVTKEEQELYKMLQDLWGRTESVDDVFDEVSGYAEGMRKLKAENEDLQKTLETILKNHQNKSNRTNTTSGFIPYYQPTLPTITAAPEQSHPVPEGYVLVPVEPTEDMTDAGYEAYGKGHYTPAILDCYRAMIAAAPTRGGE